MIAKITVGRGLRGSLDYDFSLGKDGKQRARLVAGTLAGTPRQMSAQAAPFRSLRPETRNPIWRCSLSMPPSERQLSDSEWKKIAEDFLQEMGVDLEKSAWAAVRHSDRQHSHIHISLLRITSEGKLWDRANDVPRAIATTQRLEQKYGLLSHPRERPQRLKQAPKNTDSDSPTPSQPPKKGKTMSVISKIQSEVDQVLTAAGVGGMTLGELKKRLLLKQVLLEEHRTKQGTIMGFRYQYNSGALISASQVGSAYGLGLAERGVAFGEQTQQKESDLESAKDKVNPEMPRGLETRDPAELAPSIKLAAHKPAPKPQPQPQPQPKFTLQATGNYLLDGMLAVFLAGGMTTVLLSSLLSFLKFAIKKMGFETAIETQKIEGTDLEKITKFEIIPPPNLPQSESDQLAEKAHDLINKSAGAIQNLNPKAIPHQGGQDQEEDELALTLVESIIKSKMTLLDGQNPIEYLKKVHDDLFKIDIQIDLADPRSVARFCNDPRVASHARKTLSAINKVASELDLKWEGMENQIEDLKNLINGRLDKQPVPVLRMPLFAATEAIKERMKASEQEAINKLKIKLPHEYEDDGYDEREGDYQSHPRY